VIRSFIAFTKKAVLILWLLAMIVAGAWFATENPEKISPVFFGILLPQLSLGIYLCGALILGVFLGASLSFMGTQSKMFRVKRERSALSKKVKRLESMNVSTQAQDLNISSLRKSEQATSN